MYLGLCKEASDDLSADAYPWLGSPCIGRAGENAFLFTFINSINEEEGHPSYAALDCTKYSRERKPRSMMWAIPIMSGHTCPREKDVQVWWSLDVCCHCPVRLVFYWDSGGWYFRFRPAKNWQWKKKVRGINFSLEANNLELKIRHSCFYYTSPSAALTTGWVFFRERGWRPKLFIPPMLFGPIACDGVKWAIKHVF